LKTIEREKKSTAVTLEAGVQTEEDPSSEAVLNQTKVAETVARDVQTESLVVEQTARMEQASQTETAIELSMPKSESESNPQEKIEKMHQDDLSIQEAYKPKLTPQLYDQQTQTRHAI